MHCGVENGVAGLWISHSTEVYCNNQVTNKGGDEASWACLGLIGSDKR